MKVTTLGNKIQSFFWDFFSTLMSPMDPIQVRYQLSVSVSYWGMDKNDKNSVGLHIHVSVFGEKTINIMQKAPN